MLRRRTASKGDEEPMAGFINMIRTNFVMYFEMIVVE